MLCDFEKVAIETKERIPFGAFSKLLLREINL